MSIYALGASPEQIRQAYELNRHYQVQVLERQQPLAAQLEDPEAFQKHLGRPKNYAAYLAFFQKEIERDGVEQTLTKFIFKGDAKADDMLARMFAGTTPDANCSCWTG